MKTTFLSVVCLFFLAATSFSQNYRDDIRRVSSTGLFQTDKPVTSLYGKSVATRYAYINGSKEVIDLGKANQASYYAVLAKGEFDSILSALQQPSLPVQK